MLRGRNAKRGGGRGLETLAGILARSSPDRDSPTPSPLPARVWELAVGPRVAQRSFPQRLTRGMLTVRVASSAWAQELTLLAPTIQQRLVAQGVEVQSLRFTVRTPNTRPIKPKPPEIRRVPAQRELPTGLVRTLGQVDDPALREVIARAAAATLAWQKAFANDPPPTAPTRAVRPVRAAPTDAPPSADRREVSPRSRGGR